MTKYETISTKVQADLKEKIRKYRINASKVMREALRREVAKAEAKEIDRRLERISNALDRISMVKVMAGIREDREHC